MTTLADQAIQGVQELRADVEALETHVARLEAIVQVMLEEAAAGRLTDSAVEILKEIPTIQPI